MKTSNTEKHNKLQKYRIMSISQKTPDYINSHKTSEIKSTTQLKRDSLTKIKELPDPRLIGFTIFNLAIFLFVAAIYYGIINP
jgi:hypothetical protein